MPASLSAIGRLPAILAHVGAAPGPDEVWSAWTLDPVLLGGILGFGALYLAGLRKLRSRAGGTGALPPWRTLCFAAGWAALAVALVSPVDALGEGLFAAHMVQHLLLILVAAPLLVLGAPVLPLLWSVPRSLRRRLPALWNGWTLPRTVVRWLLRPGVAWSLFVLTFWLWHVPGPYEAALDSELLHVVEHLSFLGTAGLFWWVVLSPLGRRTVGAGGAVLCLVGAAVQGAALGALITFSTTTWYDAGSGAAQLWGLTPLEDQQLAGLVMWIPPVLVYLGAAATILAGELRRLGAAVGLAVLLAGGAAVTGCADDGGDARTVPDGDPRRGRRAAAEFGCGACHVIPGVDGANGTVGPPLTGFAHRTYIAGRVYNVSPTLVRWLLDPRSVDSATAMPAVGLSESSARDIAAYLYTLE